MLQSFKDRFDAEQAVYESTPNGKRPGNNISSQPKRIEHPENALNVDILNEHAPYQEIALTLCHEHTTNGPTFEHTQANPREQDHPEHGQKT